MTRRAAAVHRLAFYDLDRTITVAPTWSRFLLVAARRRAPWRLVFVPAVVVLMLTHAAGLIGRARLKEGMQRLLVGGSVDADAMTELADRFAAALALRPGASARIAADRAAGFRPVLATAANEFYARSIAARLGIADVIATRSRPDRTGRLSAAIEGANCYGPAKLAAIQRWMAGQGIAREAATVRVYTDHRSDADLLAWADEAFAVNPHRPLAALAAVRGWPVLDWGDSKAQAA